ncbi:MAG: hypothetical protein LBQ15_09940 [Clostridium sp.]|jgi:hypothetical protein|nr:hypothetical protein [Clostridium sp.]
MDDHAMIDDLVKMLDADISRGVGHINVETSPEVAFRPGRPPKDIQTMGCSDCSRTPLACSVPTLHEGLDDYQ